MDSLTPGVHSQPESVAAVREVLLRSAVPASSPPVPPLALDNVSSRVAEAWSIWHTSPTAHTVLAGLLPTLLTDAVATHHVTQDRRATARVLASAYQITRQWLHHIPHGELAWIAADRAINTAREADDPHLIALGAWALSASYRRAGHQDEATRLCLAAADELKPLIDDTDPQPKLFAAYGMLHLAGAVSAAQSDEDGRAWALHRVASDTVRALGNRYDPWTVFGPGNVAIHELALNAELGRADAVVDYASRLQIDDVPSVERRTRVLIDVARGFVQRGEDEAAILVLWDAERTSTDEVRHSTLVRELLRELLHRDRARARGHVQKLARLVGLILV